MPIKEPTTEKTYYPIGEVAKMFNLTVSNIRFWEQEFPQLKPKKNRKGDRFFTARDIELLKVIYHLLKEEGFTIEGARNRLSKNLNSATRKVEVVQSMKRIRSFLVSLKENLDARSGETADTGEGSPETITAFSEVTIDEAGKFKESKKLPPLHTPDLAESADLSKDVPEEEPTDEMFNTESPDLRESTVIRELPLSEFKEEEFPEESADLNPEEEKRD